MSRPDILIMPEVGSLGGAATVEMQAPNPVIIVGANGSGKSRLGSWLEFTGPQKHSVYRIGARKSLRFPSIVRPTSVEDAELSFLYGVDLSDISAFKAEIRRDHTQAKIYSRHKKWRENPEINSLIDFVQLLTLLFSYEYEASSDYRNNAKLTTEHSFPSPTKLDTVKRVWEQVLPHRKLILGLGSVSAKPTQGDNSTSYHAGELSDGERVIFYLIGKCLVVKPGSIIVVDEPEIHVHHAIRASLWEAIEQECPDCLFVYLTHDLDFAASRTEAKKIWIKSYDGQSWDLEEVPNARDMPEALLLAVLGGRKPVLFIEGQRGSLDRLFFSRVYPDWTIMPREGCDQVIEATKSFRALKNLHGLECCGIVDRDYRTPEQAADLQTKGVYVLELQEMENLLLLEPVLELVAAHVHAQSGTDDAPAEIVRKAKERIFDKLRADIELLAARKTAWELETKLHKINRTARSVAQIEQERDAAAQFDVAGTYAEHERKLTDILARQDYVALLRVYNNKGLGAEISRFFNTDSYSNLVKRLVGNGQGEHIIAALRATAPILPAVIA